MAQEYRSDLLERTLRNLHLVLGGVKASVIVNVDGLLVAAFPPSADDVDNPTNSPQVAAMAATLIGLAENTLTRLAQGKLDRILMEGEEGTMLVYPAGRVAAIAVLMDKSTKLDRAFFAASKAAEEVIEVLGPH